MNFTNKFRTILYFNHSGWIRIYPCFSFKIQIISDHIGGTVIFLAVSGLKKSNNLLGIIKPFIIIEIHEPFSMCFSKSRIPCHGKVSAPGEINNFIRIFFSYCSLLLIASRIYQYDFTWKCFFER